MSNSQRRLWVWVGAERAAVFGDGADGRQQFAHGRAGGDLVRLAALDEPTIEDRQPGIALSRSAERRPP